VPKATGGGVGSEAATWIGAQAAFGHTWPFVQIGTIERSDGDYEAFWSDEAHGFRIEYLAPVFPGDWVSARITRTGGAWRLVLDDRTAHLDGVHVSDDGIGQPFELADWFQEDPKDLRLGQPFPYPNLATVTFRGLVLNGNPPSYPALYAQWLSLPANSYFAPTLLAGDQFSLRPASVSRVGERYLDDVAAANAAYSAFFAQASRWSDTTTADQAVAGAKPVVRAFHAEQHALATQRWPPNVQAKIAKSLALQSIPIADLEHLHDQAPGTLSSWLAALERDVKPHVAAGHKIRRALHLPEIN
jgi:hypothetical protein